MDPVQFQQYDKNIEFNDFIPAVEGKKSFGYTHYKLTKMATISSRDFYHKGI